MKARQGIIVKLLNKVYNLLKDRGLVHDVHSPGTLCPPLETRPEPARHVHWHTSSPGDINVPTAGRGILKESSYSGMGGALDTPVQGGLERFQKHQYHHQQEQNAVYFQPNAPFENSYAGAGAAANGIQDIQNNMQSPEPLSESFLQPITFDNDSPQGY